MGKGGQPQTRATRLSSNSVLARTHLTPERLAVAFSPLEVARAIRAELWFGTLRGARSQARLAGTVLAGRDDAWTWPALIYIVCGPDMLAAVASRRSHAIAGACKIKLERVLEALAHDPHAAAADLLELADVLGPIAASQPTDEFVQLLTRAITLCTPEQDPPSRASAAAAAMNTAFVRLEAWVALARRVTGATTRAVTAYEATPDVLDWTRTPSFELLMLLDLDTTDGIQSDVARLRALPPTLRGESRFWLI